VNRFHSLLGTSENPLLPVSRQLGSNPSPDTYRRTWKAFCTASVISSVMLHGRRWARATSTIWIVSRFACAAEDFEDPLLVAVPSYGADHLIADIEDHDGAGGRVLNGALNARHGEF
jgi:hypothetical protein